MKFTVRVDDFAWTPQEAERVPMKKPDIGMRVARRFHEAMQGVPYIAGVIPSCVDEEGRAWLGSVTHEMTVALHGYTHRPVDGVMDEFHGMPMEEMRRLLDLGQKRIGHTKHFIAPFNSIERDLPEACWHEGIRYLWGAPSTWVTPPQPHTIFRDVLFIPSWLPLYGATAWSQGGAPIMLRDIPAMLDLPGLAVLTLHITWEAAKDEAFVGVRALVKVIRDRVVSPEEFCEEAKR